MSEKKFIGIIPARYASTRFPGKPLAPLLGKPLFFHVYERASRCRELHGLYLATDHEAIQKEAQRLNVEVIMTSSKHPSGTDRVFEAALHLGAGEEDVIINIQGDEPLLEPEMISSLIDCFKDPHIKVATLARRISFEEVIDPNIVKVVLNVRGEALYFSRSPIPYYFNSYSGQFLGHVGMYAFRFSALREFTSLSPSPLEQAERLEQLRLLENGIPIHVSITPYSGCGVDTPEDLAKVEKILRKETCPCQCQLF